MSFTPQDRGSSHIVQTKISTIQHNYGLVVVWWHVNNQRCQSKTKLAKVNYTTKPWHESKAGQSVPARPSSLLLYINYTTEAATSECAHIKEEDHNSNISDMFTPWSILTAPIYRSKIVHMELKRINWTFIYKISEVHVLTACTWRSNISHHNLSFTELHLIFRWCMPP